MENENKENIMYQKIHSKDSDGYKKWTSVEYISKEQYLQEKIVEQAKKDGYEAGYLFDNDESIISWNELKKIDGIFSNTNLIDVIDDIKESNKNLSEKELKEEVVFRVLEDNVDWHGFDHSLIDNEQIDSGKLLETRCYILEQVSEAVVDKEINSFKEIQNRVDELLKNNQMEEFNKRYKDKAIEICSKENSSLTFTMFIKELTQNLTQEEKILVLKESIDTLINEITKTNKETVENSSILNNTENKTNTNKRR